MYLWIVVVGAIGAVFAAYGIGANDVANAFATSVGSKSLTIKQAVVLAGIFEFSGALLLGSHVVKTISQGIADVDCFRPNPGALMYGMSCVIYSTGFWLVLASYLELPVSTTHSTVGGIVGMAMAFEGPGCVNWYERRTSFPFIGGVSGIVLSWIISPVFAAIVASLLFTVVRAFVLRQEDSYRRAFFFFPVLVAVTLVVNIFFIMYKGAKGVGLDDTNINTAFVFSFGIGCGVALLMTPTLLPYLARKIDAQFRDRPDGSPAVNKYDTSREGLRVLAMQQEERQEEADAESLAGLRVLAMDMKRQGREHQEEEEEEEEEKEEMMEEQNGVEEEKASRDLRQYSPSSTRAVVEGGEEQPTAPPSGGSSSSPSFSSSRWGGYLSNQLGKDPHAVIGQSEYVSNIHDNAEKFAPKAEELFKYVQVFTAICDSFSHGANDVANAMGPFTAIYVTFKTGMVDGESAASTDSYWILALGGAGIVLGLSTYGYKIMSAIGVKIAKITPSRGFAIELASAIVIVIGSRLEIPLSTTHCQVGATMGVALLEGRGGLNWVVLLRAVLGWLFTLVVCGLSAAILFAQGFYAPSPDWQQL